MIKILQFAVLPPPIGGVTMHVQRLTKRLENEDNIKTKIFDYSKNKNVIQLIKDIFWADIIHIHLSNKKIRKKLISLLNFLNKKSLVTFHGKYDFSNPLDHASLKNCHAAIILNDTTYRFAKKIKIKNIYRIGAFLPPTDYSELPTSHIEKIKHFKKKYQKVFCTNASSYVRDENGKEIYMGSEILQFFQENPQWGLIFSDSSKTYFQYFEKENIEIPDNVYIIEQAHDFVPVIKMSNGFIRSTTKDGDSLSVKEALFFNKPVYATDVVDRPEGCVVFHTLSELTELLNYQGLSPNTEIKDNYFDVLNIYKELLK